ncbi:MAG: hypothetical protein EXS35_11830 [Pedosphaera sp.]|nr:hypothetical protein [Pedosphaera sp.]
MKAIVVRNLTAEVLERFKEVAASNHRNAEAHARFLIEREVSAAPADTCGELAERIWADPAPDVDVKKVDSYLATRGRRSNRP